MVFHPGHVFMLFRSQKFEPIQKRKVRLRTRLGLNLQPYEKPISQQHFPANMTSLRTCAECNNILYPREDPDNKRLLYACRHCDYSEIASQAVVYRNDLQKSASETAGVTTDVASDPTLVRLRS